MICRNCSAEIEDRSEKCPFCHKDPKKRNHRSAAGPILCILLILAVVAAVYVGLSFDEVKAKIASVFPVINSTSSTVLTSEEESSSVSTTATTSSSGSTAAQSESSSPTSAESKSCDLSKAEIAEFSVFSKDGKELSKRGLITAEKEKVKVISQTQFGEFCLQKISRSPYSWLTVKFDDSTGIVFTGNCATSAVYCTLDENDYIKEVLGTILLSSDGTYVYTENKKFEEKTDSTKESKTTAASEVSSKQTTEKTTEEKTSAAKTTSEKPSVTANKNAQSRAATQTTEERQENQNSSTVYITDSGKKYHRGSCSSLSKSKHAISVKDAKSKGYEPCKRCKP